MGGDPNVAWKIVAWKKGENRVIDRGLSGLKRKRMLDLYCCERRS
jgi:hypothetical protein